MRGAIFVHGIAAVPWVALIVGIGLTQVDPAQEEAALLVLPPRGVLWRITLPQALPFVVAAAIWIGRQHDQRDDRHQHLPDQPRASGPTPSGST